MFYNGEDNPSDEVVLADVLAITRAAGPEATGKTLKYELRAHFQGKVSDKRLARALEQLMSKY